MLNTISKGNSNTNIFTQYAQQESNEVERYSKTEIAAPLYDP